MAAVLAATSPMLIVWHHSNLPSIARKIAGGHLSCPDEWPDDRFDVTWVLDHVGHGSWNFSQIPQRLLPVDSLSVI